MQRNDEDMSMGLQPYDILMSGRINCLLQVIIPFPAKEKDEKFSLCREFRIFGEI